jgi:choline dehydrogenase-like flavoprotein
MTYDYIITGAGPAGCVLANRLSEDSDVRVLLLEAGGGDWNPLFHMPAGFAKMTKGVASWGWETVPQKHMKGRVLRYTQAKVIGGGSSINAQLYTRGNAADYDLWASEDGCTGWDYRSVCPISSARKTTSVSPTTTMAMAGRSACRCRRLPCRSAMPISAPARSSAFPTTTTSTAASRPASASTN